MIRPLPPFTARPLRLRKIRKSASPAAILELASEFSASVKASRKPIKASGDRDAPRMRVLRPDQRAE